MSKVDPNIIRDSIRWFKCAREVESCRKHVQEHPDLDPPKLALSQALIGFAHGAIERSDYDKALDALNEAVDLLGQLMTRDPSDTLVIEMVGARVVRPVVLMALGRLDESLADTLDATRFSKDLWRAGHRLAPAWMLWMLRRHKRKLRALSPRDGLEIK